MFKKWIQKLALVFFVVIAIRYHLESVRYFYQNVIRAPKVLSSLTESGLPEALSPDVLNAVSAFPKTEKSFSLSLSVQKDPEFDQRIQESLFPAVYDPAAKCRFFFPSEATLANEKIIFSGKVTLACRN